MKKELVPHLLVVDMREGPLVLSEDPVAKVSNVEVRALSIKIRDQSQVFYEAYLIESFRSSYGFSPKLMKTASETREV